MKSDDCLVERPRYTDKIIPFVQNGNVKIVTGIRRCGKSSVMRIFSKYFDEKCNIIYISMEWTENYNLRQWNDLLNHIENMIDETRQNVLFIDEVQNVEGWELAVRDLVSKNSCDIYLTGSNSNLLSSEYATHLGGRFNEIRMFPLSYEECEDFQKAFGGKDTFERFVRVGGFPILWRKPLDIQSSMQTVRDLVDVSITNDIVERFGVKNLLLLKDLLRYVLSTIGNYVSANNLYNTMRSSGIKVSADTVYDYLSYLESANILIRANVFDIKGKRVLTAKSKYYVTDLGIKHAILGYRPEDTPGHLENIIFTELIGRGYNVYVGDLKDKEIDFVAEKDEKRIYIQACQTIGSEETMKRELGNLEMIDDSFPKYVVMMDPGVYEGVTEKGIICCNIENFIKKEL